MLDLTQFPSLTPDTLRGPRPSGPIRLSLEDAPERERAVMYREFLGRMVMRVDVEPVRDLPFEIDMAAHALPGLQLLAGRAHGYCSTRTRELLADGNDEVGLTVNLGGPYLVTRGQQELVLGDGEATLMSIGDPCSFTRRPPGCLLVLRFPRAQFAPLVTNVDDCCLRPIP